MNKGKYDLGYWQQKFVSAKSEYDSKIKTMEDFDAYYNGTKAMPKVKGSNAEHIQEAFTVRNIVYELIEAQVDNSIPQPKVTAVKAKYEENARKLENKLRNELDRLPFEYMNDLQERVCPVQGGSIFHIEWDNFKRTHTTVGELCVSLVHPKQFIPQPGVYEIEDMDYMFLMLAQTKQFIKQRYGVDVSLENESEQDVESYAGNNSDDKVTQVICYFRNDEGGIGKFSWVNDTVLEDLYDYQERKKRVCKRCGNDTYEDVCPECGGRKFESASRRSELLSAPLILSNGGVIPAGAEIEYYMPKVYPVVVRRNVSSFGSFLGKSDVEVIQDQQDNIKKLNSNIMEKLLMGGSLFTLPAGLKVKLNDQNMRVVELKDPSQKNMIDTFSVQPDVSKDMNMMELEYETARQELGITDSFQGRRDATATSGKAKEFAASQSAGRLESKRVMKSACYGALFEVMAKFLIAFCDEPRPLITEDMNGNPLYEEFSRYEFLEQDAAGKWYYNVDYLFSTDASGSMAQNREAMWQETRMNLQQGAFGDPADPNTLLLFWQIMESLHYPGANKMKKQIEGKIAEQNQMLAMQNQMQSMGQQMQSMGMENQALMGQNNQLMQQADALQADNAKMSEAMYRMMNGGE